MEVNPLVRRRFARRSSKQFTNRRRLNYSIIAIGGSLTLLLSAMIVLGALGYSAVTTGLPSLDIISNLLNPGSGDLLQPSRIYDRSGKHVLMVLSPWEAPRSYAPIDPKLPNHLPDTLTRATVALLDPEFWSQPGNRFDSILNPDDHRGLTQTLVFNLLLWDEPAGWRRAAREQILSAQISTRYNREQIIEWYLNSANYGHYAYGADAAARLYLGKPVSDLNLAEAALLASVSQSPAINPLDAPKATLEREQQALNEIQLRGFATPAEVEQARNTRINFQAAPITTTTIAPAFDAMVLSQLDNQFSNSRVEMGGMQILTTLDFDIQVRSTCALQTQLGRLNNPSAPNLPSCDGAELLPPLPPTISNQSAQTASAVVLDPHSGQLLALIGDTTNNDQEATFLSPHLPGTLLTPFIYLTAFTRGLSPGSLLWDLPSKNADATAPITAYKGPMRLRNALTTDNLNVAGQLFSQMGAGLVQQTMAPFGLDVTAASFKDFIGSDKQIPIVQIAQTYGVFATLGSLNGLANPDGIQPFALLEIKSLGGQTFAEWNSPSTAQVLSPQLAYLLTDVLSANFSDVNFPAAYKTGINPATNETWAAGYTPQRVTVVWMGGKNSADNPGYSRYATEGLWTAIMQTASRGQTPDGWPQPAGMVRLKVCDPSGMLPTDACPNVVDEVFIEGYQPMQTDTLYRKFAVNRETNLLATVFTPQQLVEQRVYMLLPPEAEAWAQATVFRASTTGYDYFHPPSQYDNIQPPAPDQNANISSPGMFAVLQGKVTITGTAAGTNFSYYRLQYGQGLNPGSWIQIGEDAHTPVGNGPLAEWDTSGLKGLYSLQLLVVHQDHSLQIATVQVSINNP